MTKSLYLACTAPIIETKRLKISPLKPDYADCLFEPFSDPDLYPYIFWEVPESLQSLRTKFERICAGKSRDGKQIWLNWVAIDKSTQHYCGFYEATIEGRIAMLAYYTFKPFQRKGYAKEGMAAVMECLALKYDLEKFVVEIDTRNRASAKLAEALGFHWVETVNNACDLKGFQSHEFRFEKTLRPQCGLITKGDVSDYILFRYPDKADDEREKEANRLLANFHRYVSDNEQIFICRDRNKIVGSACLLQFQPGSFGIVNLTLENKGGFKAIFSNVFATLVDEVTYRKGTQLEYRLVEGDMANTEVSCLEQAGFRQQYHRTEFNKQLDDLSGDLGTPLTWRTLPDTSDQRLKELAGLMTKAAQGDPDFHPEDDAFECIQGYLAENDLTHGIECFQIGRLEGKDAAVVIAQVDKRNGWSRITYMGVLPEFRNRGLGKWVHRHGFQMMKEQGGTYYHGGTLSNNKPMMRLFEKHGCEKLKTRQGWVLDVGSQ